MKIVPPPRSSYVRVKLVGAPPDSYFDFAGFNFQDPTNGSFVVGAVTAVRGGGGTAAGLAGRDPVCALATTPDERRSATRSIKAIRELRMSRLRDMRSTPLA